MNFDLAGPLPTGTTVIEASAGSGKTYAIVGLATRYVAEGVVDLAHLMLVTFGRAATQELRDRTWERFTSTVDDLADISLAQASDDELIVFLARGTPDEVAARRKRLIRALADFDAATIATTHSFCQQMLEQLGLAGDSDPHATVVESIDDLIAQVTDDLYLRDFAAWNSPTTRITPAAARKFVYVAISDRQALLAPENEPVDSVAGQRVALSVAARTEVDRRKRAAGIRHFDDLLVLLRDALTDPHHGAAAADRIRARYSVVLVDEFQDTDPVQWEILRLAFHGATKLILVGDPKQAIYAFRGAEVLSYLEAVRVADHHLGLATNWRSDAPLMQGLDHLYGRAALGHSEIVVQPLRASHTVTRLHGQAPLRLRYLGRKGAGRLNASGFPAVGALRSRVAVDVAGEIVELLVGGAEVEVDGPARPVEPRDIAVLVRTGKQGELVRDALDRVGVPSVVAGGTSVFETPSATEWLWLLQAMSQPHRSPLVRLAALTSIIGRTAAELDAAGEDIVTEVSGQLRELAALFAQAGFAAVYERLGAQTGLESRLLSVQGGERQVTDLRHIGQLLNGVAVGESLGLTALTRWLADRVNTPASGPTKDRSRRLDSDAAAVQIVTVHGSKGLEFPVVYVPYAWYDAAFVNEDALLLHNAAGQRTRDVGGKGSAGYARRRKQDETEAAGEELRLLYVALTRAMCQVVMWWAPSYGTKTAPLHRLLLGRSPGDPEPAPRVKVAEDDEVATELTAWGAGAPAGVISVEAVGEVLPVPVRWTPTTPNVSGLAAARFDRTLDLSWRRLSYTRLTMSAHDAPGVSSEAEVPETTDEPDEAPVVEQSLDGPASLMNDLPAGPAFGTLVHEVLESVDTTTTDLSAELAERCRTAVATRLAAVDPGALATALLAVMQTPLGFGTLADIGSRDRLTELDFELPLAGGRDPVATAVTLTRMAALLRDRIPADDPLAPYADRLDQLEAAPLRGYLAGSIDLVLRIPGPLQAEPAFVIVDYKTNRLARGDLTALHFSRDRMAAEMMHAHYPLQALFYSVALHRYLRWRQPGYDPAHHLGGVQYHFVRGMVGTATPPGCGVFDWKPPTGLVADLSDLLAGR